MKQVIKNIRGVIDGFAHRSTVSPSANKYNNSTASKADSGLQINQNNHTARFNLLTILDLFLEFEVDVNRGAALRVLLDKIMARTYSNLINDFYYNAADVTMLLDKWNKADCRRYIIRPTTEQNDGVYVLLEVIDLYLHNCNIYVQPNGSPEQKIELLINYYFKEGYTRFIKRYESRINTLKNDPYCKEAFESIRLEMKSYLEF